MTLNSKISVIVICSDIKMGEFESLNFDFYVVNFNTMKLIFSARVSETLMPQGFLDIEKERKLQYQWYHNFRSYVVEMTRFELAASTSRTWRATICATSRNFVKSVGMFFALLYRNAPLRGLRLKHSRSARCHVA